MLKWVGNTKGLEGIVGVPARDLTEEEVKQFNKRDLIASGCYTEVKKVSKQDGTRD